MEWTPRTKTRGKKVGLVACLFRGLSISAMNHNSVALIDLGEGHFTHWKSVRDFFLKTKGFWRKVYEIFGSEMPLGPRNRSQAIGKETRPILCKF